jgi:two-component system chemotaxis sensor kinase CheA
MDELLEQFLIEGREQVQQAAEDLMALERDGADAARIDSAFRAVHTLKGGVALFDFPPMAQALHRAEDLLSALRDGRAAASRPLIDALLDCIGLCETWLASIGRDGALPDDAALQGARVEAALRQALAPGAQDAAPAVAAEGLPGKAARGWMEPLLARRRDAVTRAQAAGQTVLALRYTPRADCFFLGDDPMALARAIPALIGLHIAPREPWPDGVPDPFACNLVIEALSTAPAEEIRRIFRFVPDQLLLAEVAPPAAPAEAPAPATASRSLRVDVDRIDALVDIVGELMVAKNGLADLASRAGGIDPAFMRALGAYQAEMDRLVGGMHRAVMAVRMTPLSQTFRRFPRLVRDTAARLGKEVAFELLGEEVEADKSVVDGLFEPLLHLLRNALDHGVESPAARQEVGKPPAGRIVLGAARQGDQIVITVTDDGAGLDPAKLRRIAGLRGLRSQAELDALDDAGALDLIFVPGFSTAAAIGAVSGRGVGMDAVRAAVAGLGGRITVLSTPGAGATVRLALPRAVIVNTVLTVRVGEEAFGVPIEAVAETTQVPAGRILPVGSGEAFVLRDRTLPLLRLAELLGLPPAPRPPGGVKVLVVASGAQRVGIEVDGFAGRSDVLLRPMAGLLAGTLGVLGTVLRGDGRLLLVLDLPELIG